MIRAIVTDIEGTTSSLSFVKDVLFPFARSHMGEFVAAHASQPNVRALLRDAQALAGQTLDDAGTVAELCRWIDEDRKATPLKALQGLIWEAGYRTGAFRGHVYEDAVRQLRAWHERGIKLYVYSSGSVWAQRLLFAYSDFGDLTPLFSGYFDTETGGKREPESYRRIASAVHLPATEILFLSDIVEELDAARAVGMETQWLVRAGTLDAAARHPQRRDFDAVTGGWAQP